jgi:hypothetical protein
LWGLLSGFGLLGGGEELFVEVAGFEVVVLGFDVTVFG